jgi:hypothetical protein
MRRFVRIDLGREPLARRDDRVPLPSPARNARFGPAAVRLINAPSSTKNAEKARDPEMHQTKKGNQWYFGMKAHLGVDSRTGAVEGRPRQMCPRPGAVTFASRCALRTVSENGLPPKSVANDGLPLRSPPAGGRLPGTLARHRRVLLKTGRQTESSVGRASHTIEKGADNPLAKAPWAGECSCAQHPHAPGAASP